MAFSMYRNALQSAPLTTKSCTSVALALLGQRIASAINGAKVTHRDRLAFGAFGCVVRCALCCAVLCC